MASNPWLKKNPFLSMWLSGANAVAGAARGKATAAVNRQAKAATTSMVKEFVAASLAPIAPKKRTVKARKRK